MSNEYTRRQLVIGAAGALGVAGAASVGVPGCADPTDPGDDALMPDDTSTDELVNGAYPVAFSRYDNAADANARMAAVRRAIESTGLRADGSADPDWWLADLTGQTVLVKPAQNSPFPYPFTVSPESAAAVAMLCLERGARRVIIADCMGIEHTLYPGGRVPVEGPFGRTIGAFDPSRDATLRAMELSGLIPGLRALLAASDRHRNVGVRLGLEGASASDRVVFTSFREHNWSRVEFDGTWAQRSRMRAGWVRSELSNGTNWQGRRDARVYFRRKFDSQGPQRLGIFDREVPGMLFPAVFDQADHVVNLTRVATHIWSHWTGSIKNWIGCQRPDERVWMHQLNYLRNRRPAPSANHPIRNECPYHEILPELHIPSLAKERLCVADGTQVVVSGGPDGTDKATFEARTIVAARDMVSADLAQLALIKMGVQRNAVMCAPQPQSNGQLLSEFFRAQLPWVHGEVHMHGTDVKHCNPQFSNWDWLAIRRARELGMGPAGPVDLRVRYDGAFTRAQRAFLTGELRRAPTIPLEGTTELPPLAPPTADELPLATDESPPGM